KPPLVIEHIGAAGQGVKYVGIVLVLGHGGSSCDTADAERGSTAPDGNGGPIPPILLWGRSPRPLRNRDGRGKWLEPGPAERTMPGASGPRSLRQALGSFTGHLRRSRAHSPARRLTTFTPGTAATVRERLSYRLSNEAYVPQSVDNLPACRPVTASG